MSCLSSRVLYQHKCYDMFNTTQHKCYDIFNTTNLKNLHSILKLDIKSNYVLLTYHHVQELPIPHHGI